MKLKEVRHQPLLNVPKQDRDFIEIPPGDRQMMIRGFEAREGQTAYGFSRMGLHYLLKSIGLPQRVSDEDLKGVQNELEDYDGKNFGMANAFAIAHMHFHMRGLGFRTEMKPKHEVDIRGLLTESRQKGTGLWIAELHYMMRELGLKEEVTAEDKKAMVAGLNMYRMDDKAKLVSEMHFMLRELGLPQKFTEEDEQAFETGLADARENGDFLELAETYYYMNRLRPKPDEKGRTPMPPLKRLPR